jgi:hypothetical protein
MTKDEPEAEGSPVVGSLKFPFFDIAAEQNLSRSYSAGHFTPPPRSKSEEIMRREEVSPDMSSGWDTEISPISKSRESDAGGGMLHVSSDDPTGASKAIVNEGANHNIEGMASNLKNVLKEDFLNAHKDDEARHGKNIYAGIDKAKSSGDSKPTEAQLSTQLDCAGERNVPSLEGPVASWDSASYNERHRLSPVSPGDDLQTQNAAGLRKYGSEDIDPQAGFSTPESKSDASTGTGDSITPDVERHDLVSFHFRFLALSICLWADFFIHFACSSTGIRRPKRREEASWSVVS